MEKTLYNTSMKPMTQKNRKHNKRIFVSALILFLILSTLTGCFPNNYTRGEKNAFLREAKKVASSYLLDRYRGAKIQKIEPRIILKDGEWELTEFAQGQFAWKWKTYNFVVNTETGEVYTSVYFEEVEERLEEELLRELGIVSEEMVVEYCDITYLKDAEKLNGDCFENVFPEEESAEKLLEKILQDTETYRFFMQFRYKGEDLSVEMMEREPPFPTLSGVVIYHIAEEHALPKGDYFAIPILSKEIMKLRFYKDTASYTRYQTLEQDGLRVIYNACERTREQDTIMESVITEEDITLTITDEFIRLDCTKDNYSMYLLTDDKKITKKYRYVFSDSGVAKEGETQRGIWYSFEDGYIYAENLLYVKPYKIDGHNSAGNVIYSSPQKK